MTVPAPTITPTAGPAAGGRTVAAGLASLVQRKLWPDAWPSWFVDTGFSVWALGFLALVLFGFYMRVRNVRL